MLFPSLGQRRGGGPGIVICSKTMSITDFSNGLRLTLLSFKPKIKKEENISCLSNGCWLTYSSKEICFGIVGESLDLTVNFHLPK